MFKFILNTAVPGFRVGRPDDDELGFNVFETPLDEFLKAGGSAKCLTLIIG